MPRKVLLVEPAYKNKYPPLGLMKISTYHKMLGDDVTFIKGTSAFIKNEKWDRVYVTTLFSFYWDITVRTIQYYKRSVVKTKDFYIGGILASTMPEQIEDAVGIVPFKGLLDKKGILDDNNIVIDELTPDYDILDQIPYKYPANDSYITYMSRGCVNTCKFCAVPIIEPKYLHYISIKSQIETINKLYGEKTHLLLMDNNVLGSDKFEEIIDEIKALGFHKGAVLKPSNLFDIYYKRLSANPSDNFLVDKIISLLTEFMNGKVRNNEAVYESTQKLLNGNNLFSSNDNANYLDRLSNVYNELSVIYDKYRNKSLKQRHVDFNQGIDARLFTKDKARKISEINIRPLRIAFDNVKLTKHYINAVKNAAEFGITDLSNYILYNYEDSPIDLYRRLELNIKLNKELGVKIYSFPMKYIPVTHTNRNDHYGPGWNKKYIRAIQAILNVTKGSVAPGESFFYRAFGATEEEFFKILIMPEDYIINRIPSENKGYTQQWWSAYSSLNSKQRDEVNNIIISNDFSGRDWSRVDNKILEVLAHYTESKMLT